MEQATKGSYSNHKGGQTIGGWARSVISCPSLLTAVKSLLFQALVSKVPIASPRGVAKYEIITSIKLEGIQGQ